MSNAIIQQGTFVSSGVNKTVIVRSDVDWMRIVNLTQAAATNNGYGYEYFWHASMTAIAGLVYYHPAADHSSAVNSIALGAGFSKVDSSTYALGAQIVTVGATNATQPVVTTGTTTGLSTGTIVRKIETVTPQYGINGLDFSIDTVVAGNSFRLANAMANVQGRAGGAGIYRIVAPDIDTYKLYNPSSRVIANITRAANGVVTTLVDHGYAVGDKVRFSIPSDGNATMTELSGQTGTITAVTAGTFTIDINTAGYTAFTFPAYDATPCLYPQVVPFGESTNILNPLYNQGYIGMSLVAGTTGPAGNNNDVIVWMAGKSFNV